MKCWCGEELDWDDCEACGGECFTDAYEDDPINNSPGELEVCPQCSGRGGFTLCWNADKHDEVLQEEFGCMLANDSIGG